MGMKLTVEIELDFPDLSTEKHIGFLKHVFKNQMVKSVDLINNNSGQKISVISNRCNDCKGNGCCDCRGVDCEGCSGTGVKE